MAKDSKEKQSRVTNTSNRKDVLVRNGQAPPVPSPRSNWVDSTISEDLFWKKREERNTCASQQPDKIYRLIEPEPHPTQRELIAADSVLRFRNERKELPFSHTQFVFPRQTIPGWRDWVIQVFKDSKYKEMLRLAKVYRAIDISTHLNFEKMEDMKLWRYVISRWSVQTHTFVAAWGEFTPTLEDVYMLKLFEFGKTDITTLTASQEEEDIISELAAALKASRVKTKKSIFTSWIEYFTQNRGKDNVTTLRPHLKHLYELAAFVALWLSVYIFPGGPEEGVNPRLFLLAIRIAKGECFALAPFYLGSFYRRLDLYHHASVRSKGRYTIYSHADLMFLQLFIYERFQSYTSQPRKQDPQLNTTRVKATLKRKPLGLLSNVIDNTNGFTFRPYLKKIEGYEDCSEYYSLKSNVFVTLVDDRESLDIHDATFILWCTPGYLPSLQDNRNSISYFLEQRVMVYSPHRVARQFGFDQGVPRLLPPLEDFNGCCQLICPKDIRFIYPNVRQLFFPSTKRGGLPTPGWLTYWTVCLEKFDEYASAIVDDTLEAPLIYKQEFYLHLPSSRSSNLSKDFRAKSKTKCASQVKNKVTQDCQGSTSATCNSQVRSKVARDSTGKQNMIHDSRVVEKVTNQAKRVCIREVVEDASIHSLVDSAPRAIQIGMTSSSIDSVQRSIVSALPVSQPPITYPFPHCYGDSGRLPSKSRNVPLTNADEGNEGVEKSDPEQASECEESDYDRASESASDSDEDSLVDDDEEYDDDVEVHDQSCERDGDDFDPSHSEDGEDENCADTLPQIANHGDEADVAPIDVSQHVAPSREASPPDASIAEHMSFPNVPSPPIAGMPSRGGTTTLEMRASAKDSISFHGFIVPSHILEPLEWLYSIEGEFWADCVVSGTDVVGAMINVLGGAIESLSKPWSSLSTEELELLIKVITGARGLNFKIGCLERVASKVQKLLNCQDAMKRVNQLRVELEEAELHLKKLLGDQDISHIARMDITP